ncbi:MAG: Holliday junction resolvase RuvX [Candidatus Omnitrophica bacterium]|nr:Holliday junction resolvase RuvX [Candidatus Omnitrophota bacterium]
MGRILGIDFGERRMGLAISDELKITAQGINVWETRNQDEDLLFLKSIIKNYGVDKIVIGIPLDKYGKSTQSSSVSEFINILRKNLNLPIETWDERFTTLEAERMLIQADVKRKKRRQVIDKISAQIILQSYLDYNANIKNHNE